MVGEHLGEYELLDKLGEGGMGEVYLARHAKLGGPVAIKILKPSLSADDKLVQRFWGEAKAAASIQHPAIAQVLDVGRTHDGSAFLVMEYLRGETLRQRLRSQGPLEERHAIGFAKQLASVLAAAHAKGIIHRDIKPENIFIVSAPEIVGGERVKLLDFGVAKLTDPQSGMNLTQTGDVIGTPMYMSPEQCRGTGQYDDRTDLYSLGCVLFEMICGRPPFVSKFPGDVMAAHIGTPPPAASELRQVSGPLEGLLKKLLEKDPDNRVPSADAFLVILDSLYDDDATVLDSAPLMTRAPSSLEAATLRPPGAGKLRRPSSIVAPQETTLTSAAGATGEVPLAGHSRRTIWYTAGASLAVIAIILIASLGRGEPSHDDSATQHPAAAPAAADVSAPAAAAPAAASDTPTPAPADDIAEPRQEPGNINPPPADGDQKATSGDPAPGDHGADATTDDTEHAQTPTAADETTDDASADSSARPSPVSKRKRTPVNAKRTHRSPEKKPKKPLGNEAINPFK